MVGPFLPRVPEGFLGVASRRVASGFLRVLLDGFHKGLLSGWYKAVSKQGTLEKEPTSIVRFLFPNG